MATNRDRTATTTQPTVFTEVVVASNTTENCITVVAGKFRINFFDNLTALITVHFKFQIDVKGKLLCRGNLSFPS